MLLYWLLLSYWLLTIAAAVLSYFVPLLSAASAYGKLAAIQRSQPRSPSAALLYSPASLSSSPPSASAASPLPFLSSFVLAPRLYLSNGGCFTAYYALASLLNGAVLHSVYAWHRSAALDGALLGLVDLNRRLVWRLLPSAAFSSLDRHWPPAHVAAPASLLLLCAAYQLHFARRLWECAAVHRFSASSRQHVLVLLLGALFYVALVLSPACDQLQRATSGGAVQPSDTSAPRATVASLLFVVASLWQNRCHRTLAELRSPASSTAAAYSIPHGSGFSSLLCPHYTAELLIYLAFAVMRSCLLQWLAFAWTAVNLTITANKTRQWYASKWPQGEWRSRWSIVPFVF